MAPPRQTTAARRPTLRDVARRAGVSTSTASLVFSGKGPVATATAERVRTAATDLAYAGPDPLASSLRQGRVGTVAVVVEGPLRYAFHDPFALAVLDGLAEELDAAGPLDAARRAAGRGPRARPRPARDAGRRRRRLPAVRRRGQPGRRPPAGPRGARGRRSGSPVHPRVAHVLTDESAAMRLTTQHVLELGHTRVAHLSMALRPGTRRSGPLAGWVTEQDVATASYPDAAGRLRGFRSLAGPTPWWCRPTTSPSRPAKPRPAAPRAAGPPATDGRRRPGRPARRRCGAGRRVLGPAGAGGPQRHRLRRRRPALARPRAHHRRPARGGQGPGDGAARAPARWTVARSPTNRSRYA